MFVRESFFHWLVPVYQRFYLNSILIFLQIYPRFFIDSASFVLKVFFQNNRVNWAICSRFSRII